MAIKAKTKSVSKRPKPQSSVSPSRNQSLSHRLTRFDQSVVLKNKKLSIAIVLVFLVLLGVLFKSVFLAATVNGEPISRLSVVTMLEKQSGKATLESIITRKIILQEAKRKNISITQKDIDSEIKKITVNLQAQGSTLDQALAAQGMTKSDLKDEIKIQGILNKLVGADITLTEKEIDDFVEANKSQMVEGTTDAQFREQAIRQLKQQKLQAKTQAFIKSLQDKAKVIHFVSY